MKVINYVIGLICILLLGYATANGNQQNHSDMASKNNTFVSYYHAIDQDD